MYQLAIAEARGLQAPAEMENVTRSRKQAAAAMGANALPSSKAIPSCALHVARSPAKSATTELGFGQAPRKDRGSRYLICRARSVARGLVMTDKQRQT